MIKLYFRRFSVDENNSTLKITGECIEIFYLINILNI